MKLVYCCLFLILSGCAGQVKQSESKAIDIEHRAESYYKQANLELAESEYRKLVKAVPLYAKGWFRLGNIYMRMGQLDAAIVHYEKALQFDSKMSKAWHNLALARVRQATNTLVEGQQQVDKSQTFEVDSLLKKLLVLQSAK